MKLDKATFNHQAERRKLWRDVAVAYIASGNSTNKGYAEVWADSVLSAYDDRFSAPLEMEKTEKYEPPRNIVMEGRMLRKIPKEVWEKIKGLSGTLSFQRGE